MPSDQSRSRFVRGYGPSNTRVPRFLEGLVSACSNEKKNRHELGVDSNNAFRTCYNPCHSAEFRQMGGLVAEVRTENGILSSTPKSGSSKMEPRVKKRRLAKLLFLVGSFAAVAVLGFFGFVMVSRSNAANNPLNVQGKVALSEHQLRDIVNAKHLTVYWAGPVAGAKYSLVAEKAGQSFVRYLPQGRGLSDTGNTFRVIATYSQKNAFSVTQSAGAQLGNVGFTNIDGNSVFYAKTGPRDVYMGINDKDIQIEIFDPGIDQALGLSLIHDQIRQIG